MKRKILLPLFIMAVGLGAAPQASSAPITIDYSLDPGGVSGTGWIVGIPFPLGNTASITFSIPGSGTSCFGLTCGDVEFQIFVDGTGGATLRTRGLPFALSTTRFITPGGAFSARAATNIYFGPGTFTDMTTRWFNTAGGELRGAYNRTVWSASNIVSQMTYVIIGQEVPEPTHSSILASVVVGMAVVAAAARRVRRRIAPARDPSWTPPLTD